MKLLSPSSISFSTIDNVSGCCDRRSGKTHVPTLNVPAEIRTHGKYHSRFSSACRATQTESNSFQWARVRHLAVPLASECNGSENFRATVESSLLLQQKRNSLESIRTIHGVPEILASFFVAAAYRIDVMALNSVQSGLSDCRHCRDRRW